MIHSRTLNAFHTTGIGFSPIFNTTTFNMTGKNTLQTTGIGFSPTFHMTRNNTLQSRMFQDQHTARVPKITKLPFDVAEFLHLPSVENVVQEFIAIQGLCKMIVDYLSEIRFFTLTRPTGESLTKKSDNKFEFWDSTIFCIPAKPTAFFGSDVGDTGVFFCNACGSLRVYNWSNLKMFTCSTCLIKQNPFSQQCMFAIDMSTLLKVGQDFFDKCKQKELVEYLRFTSSIDELSSPQCRQSLAQLVHLFSDQFSRIANVLMNNDYDEYEHSFKNYLFQRKLQFDFSPNFKKLMTFQ